VDADPIQTLPWLRRLRWTAVIGQTVTVLVVTRGLHIPLPQLPIWLCIGLTALTNLALHSVRGGRGETPGFLGGILTADIALLTALLHFSGGPHNPFSSFYLVLVTLGAVVLPPLWAAGLGFAGASGYALLFLGGHLLPRPGDDICGVGPSLPLSLHLRGMLTAFLLTAAAVVFFAGRLQQALRRREAELVLARAAAARQDRFAALATLAAGAAHELGSPLGTISMAAGELARTLKHVDGPEELREDAELIRSEAARCRAILDRLQAQTGDAPRQVPVPGLVTELQGRFGARFQPTFLPPEASVWAPPEALTQALVSLVQNAIEASPGSSPVRFGFQATDQGCEFRISDDGPGLSPAAAIHAGEPFFTTKGPGRGMGLGLFLVRLLAERLGGSFHLTAAGSQGTCAVLRLPLGPTHPLP
jgi:two-component system sensor histidine kinase RegB